MELSIRPYADADAPDVAAFFNVIRVDDGGLPDMLTSEVREMVLEIQDVATDTRIVTAPDGSIVAFGAAVKPPADGYRSLAWGGVLPRWRGQGIGRDLIAWQLDRITDLHREVAAETGWIAEVAASVTNTSSRKLFDRFGLAAERYWFQMEAAIDSAPAPVAVAGIRIVDATTTDPVALHAADMEAFAGHFGFQYRDFEDWKPSMVDSVEYRPELSRIAYDGDEIAGFVIAFNDFTPDRLYLSAVGTRQPWRKRGIASALVAEVLAAGRAAGMAVAALGVDSTNPTGAVGVYERVGFTVTQRFVSSARPVPAMALPSA